MLLVVDVPSDPRVQVLLVEDDERLARFAAEYVEAHGGRVEIESPGALPNLKQ